MISLTKVELTKNATTWTIVKWKNLMFKMVNKNNRKQLKAFYRK